MLRRIAKWLKRLALAAVALALIGAITVYAVIRYHEADLPSVAELRSSYAPPQVTRILGRDGSTLASVFTERRTVVALTDVSDVAKLAFLAAEDASF